MNNREQHKILFDALTIKAQLKICQFEHHPTKISKYIERINES